MFTVFKVNDLMAIIFNTKSFLILLMFRERGWRTGDGEGGRERKRNIDLLFHLFMHSSVDSLMCLDQG